MKFTPTRIPDVVLIEPKVFGDGRGFFMETWQARTFSAAGIAVDFVQDNHSRSRLGALRGLHYQLEQPQGKLVRCVAGEVFDVAVDMRRSSPTFGKWVGEVLSAENRRQLWVPAGFAHGFLVLSESADFVYKCTDYYNPASEQTLAWDDVRVGVKWPLPAGVEPLLSKKDNQGTNFVDAEYFP
ncbi:MAG: dTDP-4-dehydrorhamnose 3,5-epimerase [Steroidobacteraceae bacterium]